MDELIDWETRKVDPDNTGNVLIPPRCPTIESEIKSPSSR